MCSTYIETHERTFGEETLLHDDGEKTYLEYKELEDEEESARI